MTTSLGAFSRSRWSSFRRGWFGGCGFGVVCLGVGRVEVGSGLILDGAVNPTLAPQAASTAPVPPIARSARNKREQRVDPPAVEGMERVKWGPLQNPALVSQVAPDPENEFYELHFVNSKRVKLGRTIAAVGDTFAYEYDFGDGWMHRLLLEDIMKPEAVARYPICLEGERACPPEDCGGPQGYLRFLAILANRDHEEYKQMRTWVGRAFRPGDFSIAKVNRLLRQIPTDVGGHHIQPEA